MRFVLVALTLNHFIYLYFEHFIDGVMSNPSEAGQASGYGMVYSLLIFPFQLFLELVFIVALLYQTLIVRQWKASIWYWSTFSLTLLLILDIGY
ncbi:hypothetical protein ACOMICROBIO_LKFPLAJE_01852 [Vibrio sp. B1FIG11]|nr:hypothetical protein A1Q_3856 [Vibrio campbellii HY01]CAE6907830.1 hypothetical protein ACOMICROBIO_LKFPLAJE_01852 [Vibrio sp. B1FIG11]